MNGIHQLSYIKHVSLLWIITKPAATVNDMNVIYHECGVGAKTLERSLNAGQYFHLPLSLDMIKCVIAG